VVAFFDGRPLFLLTTMGGTVHRANPFIVVVVQPTVRIVIATLFPRGGLDRSIDQLSRKSDGFGNADLALGRFFPDRPFPFPRRKKPFAPSTKVRTSSKSSSSFENHQPRCPMVVETFFDLLLVVRLKFRDKRPKGKSARAFTSL
jgi:hypothetical protein